ncbi:hypothetical protein GGI07_001660 [Coemansia sp. Benny D115]|nr:hypothetical protein GGI07_001660 [Coemansia sp. Benny D115]
MAALCYALDQPSDSSAFPDASPLTTAKVSVTVSVSVSVSVSASVSSMTAANLPAADNSTSTEAANLATLTAASSKLAAESLNKKGFSSRPVSTLSGNSMTSVDDSHEGSDRMPDTQDSFSAMPTPRNTFLSPPTGINIVDADAAPSASLASPTKPDWNSKQHQAQLQQLLEQNGVPSEGAVPANAATAASAQPKMTPAAATAANGSDSKPAKAPLLPPLPATPAYDDSYCLLAQPTSHRAYYPSSRQAAISQLRQLAGTTGTASDRKKAAENTAYNLPPLLAPPVDALAQLEMALIGVLERRSVPNRTHVFRTHRGSGAGSAAPSTSATDIGNAAASSSSASADKATRRKQRMSMMSAGQVGVGGADDKRSTRSRMSIITSEITSSLSSSGTPYGELNAHIDRLTACISKLQAATADSGNDRLHGSSKPASITGVPSMPMHRRQSSIGSLGSKSFASAKSAVGSLTVADVPMPLISDSQLAKNAASQSRLPPVNESVNVEDQTDSNFISRPRSSSRASAVSGNSTDSRRRTTAMEKPPKPVQYPSLFGFAVIPKGQQQQQQQQQQALSGTTGSFHSSHSDSANSQASGGKSQLALGIVDSVTMQDVDRLPLFASKPTSKSSISSAISAPAITVREITPASRLALWINVHSSTDTAKTSLWRRKQWQRRFAIFAGNVLYLYKSSSPAATALTAIKLTSQTIVCVNDSFQGRTWVIEVTLPLGSEPQNAMAPVTPQSWYLQTEMRNEMITLLKQLKGAVNDLQVQPDVERKEEERLRDRRRKQRKEAKTKTDVCPWEVEEFSEGGSTGERSDYNSDESDGSAEAGSRGMFRIPDSELFPSDDDEPIVDAKRLAEYSMGGAPRGERPPRLNTNGGNGYTGTGGIAEWGAHRLQMPYSPTHVSGHNPTKARSFSTDPSAGRRPSLADALAPPPSAIQEFTPVPQYSPISSPYAPPMTVRSRSGGGIVSGSSAMRNSMMFKADASALIDQMFASASRELSNSSANEAGNPGSPMNQNSSVGDGGKPGVAVGSGGSLFAVREED